MGGGGEINRTGNSHSEYLVCIVNTSSKLGGGGGEEIGLGTATVSI